MGRYVLLIDAGYLLSGGGVLCAGTGIRAGLQCSVQQLLDDLVAFTDKHSDQELLRVYWYDGAKDAVPTNEHLHIGALDRVKVRLGRLTYSGQKGVDSRIVRDIMTLARNRAITSAYLLSGDEDLREGVADAQEAGVRVTLLGIPPVTAKSNNQAQSLVREADEHVVLDKEVWEKHIRLRDDLITVELTPGFLADNTQEQVLREVGTLVAKEWVERAASEEAYVLANQHPRISKELDVDLLIAAQLATRWTFPKQLRNELRRGFWDELLASIALLDAQTLEETEN